MASSSAVKILETAQIEPISAVESSLPFTFFDTFWFTMAPVERLFFYSLNDLTPADFSSHILPNLKQSLSLTLHHFLPLAGNLMWPSNAPKPFISYTRNNGVSLTVAESDDDFHRLTGNGVFEALELHPLIPRLVSSDDYASALALQITLFPGKGFSIGITAHHMVLDGKTTTMFMKSWAYHCKQGNTKNSPLPPELTPVFDRNVIKDPTGFDLEMLYLNQWLTRTNGNKSLKISTNKGAASDLVRATVTISPEDFKKMRQRVLSKSSDGSNHLHLSPFVLTLGYITSCIVKARGGAGDRIVFLGFTADCRPRCNPPVPENYFGNCNAVLVDYSKAGSYMDFESGFEFAAEKLSKMVKGLTEKGVLQGAENRLAHLLEITKEPAGSVQMITVAGSPRFDLYGTDFGWGTPWKVVVVSIDRNEAISMAESRELNKGVEVGLALKKDEMERFLSMFLKDVY
ncbi:transferase family protein [Hibiscus syriacus]|uniref:Transferase family protein n=1 Tax=Hibiscus syriacus TaxID=106335 RepID=A0A6A3A5S6_HIBSY|nr:malonyl-CoA:anthocyanidin 5-O-glucoside-6''-O-malonyltransferase-like [Hibiscus syriacus]KAE8699691.1 transferase family protein [Hibiscus syriacus]